MIGCLIHSGWVGWESSGMGSVGVGRSGLVFISFRIVHWWIVCFVCFACFEKYPIDFCLVFGCLGVWGSLVNWEGGSRRRNRSLMKW